MIRIVFVTTGLEVGGAEVMLLNLLTALNKEEFEPIVISIGKKGPMGEKISGLGIPVHSIGLNLNRPDPMAGMKFYRIIKRVNPDLMQGWMYHGNFAVQAVKFLLKRKIPVIWSIHHTVNNLRSEKWLTAQLIRICGRWSHLPANIHYVSEISAESHERIGYASDKRVVLANGFDLDKNAPSRENREWVRKELGLSEDTLIVGLVARFHPMKDHPNFIRAAGLLNQSNPHVHFLMAGQDVDEQNIDLVELRNSLGLKERMHMLGLRNDSSRLIASLDILSTSSSFGESFPMVVGEAMASAVPCVVTDIGGSGFLVGETGRVVPPGNAQALADAWNEILTMNSLEREHLGERARERVAEYFSLQSMTRKYEALYLESIKRS